MDPQAAPRTQPAWSPVVGYALPALASAYFLAGGLSGDLVSVLLFAAAQALVERSAVWGMLTGVGLLVGWSLGSGVAAAGGLLAAAGAGLITHGPLSDAEFRLVVLPVAGVCGGAVAGSLVALLQSIRARPTSLKRWIVANAAGGALTGVGFILAFTHAAPGTVTVAVLTGIAGLAWGLLAARARRAREPSVAPGP